MMAVLARLDDFRGLSRFTTWAYKFALLEAATKARRTAWRDRELPRPPEDWLGVAAADGHPEAAAEHAELLAALRTAVAEVLTPPAGGAADRGRRPGPPGRPGRAARHHPGRPLQDHP